MALSSYFATSRLTTPSDANSKLPTFVAHGINGPILPEFLGHESVEHLRNLSYGPDYRTYLMEHRSAPVGDPGNRRMGEIGAHRLAPGYWCRRKGQYTP